MSLFQELPLAAPIHKALEKLNFVNPTPIQKSAIPLALEGKDLIACAETGSGKTAAYAIPLIHKLLLDPNPTALILTPTRELAQQITDVISQLILFCPQLRVISLVGGQDIRKQLQALKRKPRLIVATPGRLTDHLKRRSVDLSSASLLVLDEGDRMLDMGFAPQLDVILKYLPKQRQTSLFTATLPNNVKALGKKYLTEPTPLNVGRTSQPVATVKQSVIQVNSQNKEDKLMDELNRRQGSIIVFAKTKRSTDKLAKNLADYGFSVSRIHGGRTQGQRNQAIRGFREGEFRILCATDVAARGIDIPLVEHVINFDLPMADEDYVHRIGRTARNGAHGEAVSFVSPNDLRSWNALVRKYNIQGATLAGASGPSRSSDNRRSEKRRSFQGPRRAPFSGQTQSGPRREREERDGEWQGPRREGRNGKPQGPRREREERGGEWQGPRREGRNGKPQGPRREREERGGEWQGPRREGRNGKPQGPRQEREERGGEWQGPRREGRKPFPGKSRFKSPRKFSSRERSW